MKISPQEKELLGILALARLNTLSDISDTIEHLNNTKQPTALNSSRTVLDKLLSSLKTKGLVDKNFGLTKSGSIQLVECKIPVRHAIYLTQLYIS